MERKTPKFFERLASDIVGKDLRRMAPKLRNCTFRSFSGASSKVCALLWHFVDHSNNPTVAQKHLLWALLFLKIYATENVHASLAGGVDHKTFRKWSWIFVKAIANLETEFICLFVIDYFDYFDYFDFCIITFSLYVFLFLIDTMGKQVRRR